VNTPNDRTQPVQTGAVRADERHDTIHLDEHRDTTAAPVAAPVVAERHEIVPDRARGGVSFWSVLSGVLVAFGAFIVLSAIIGAILAASGVAEGGIQAGEAGDAGLAVVIGLIVAQFLAYLWGGYTAGRMARGSGVLNGLLVPVLALIFVAALGAIIAGVTGTSPDAAAADVDAMALPLPLSDIGELATGLGIGLLAAMLLGGALGGGMGARWHTKLEDGETRYTH
jgi:hypothetical protein